MFFCSLSGGMDNGAFVYPWIFLDSLAVQIKSRIQFYSHSFPLPSFSCSTPEASPNAHTDAIARHWCHFTLLSNCIPQQSFRTHSFALLPNFFFNMISRFTCFAFIALFLSAHALPRLPPSVRFVFGDLIKTNNKYRKSPFFLGL